MNLAVYQLTSALGVMVTDERIRSFLEDNDPQALKQAQEALRNYFNSIEEVDRAPSPADYIPTGLSGVSTYNEWYGR